VDTQTLAAAARALPAFTFALVGRINPDQEARVAELKRLPNVVMTGPVSIEEGNAYTAAFDAGLIPFLPGPIGDGINPVKMWMYLAEGKPVVSTWLRECRRYAPHVHAARSTEEFISAIQEAVRGETPERSAARIALASRNTWHDRAGEAIQRLCERGLMSSVIAGAKGARE
jgi:hypothetical protein